MRPCPQIATSPAPEISPSAMPPRTIPRCQSSTYVSCRRIRHDERDPASSWQTRFRVTRLSLQPLLTRSTRASERDS